MTNPNESHSPTESLHKIRDRIESKPTSAPVDIKNSGDVCFGFRSHVTIRGYVKIRGYQSLSRQAAVTSDIGGEA